MIVTLDPHATGNSRRYSVRGIRDQGARMRHTGKLNAAAAFSRAKDASA